MFGREISVEEALREIEKDASLLPQLEGRGHRLRWRAAPAAAFVASLFRRCREAGIHTALDTCGYAPRDALRERSRAHRSGAVRPQADRRRGAHRDPRGLRIIRSWTMPGSSPAKASRSSFEFHWFRASPRRRRTSAPSPASSKRWARASPPSTSCPITASVWTSTGCSIWTTRWATSRPRPRSGSERSSSASERSAWTARSSA